MDTLATINGGVTGDIIIVKLLNAAREVFIGTSGNINLPVGEEITLNSGNEVLMLFKNDGGYWDKVSYSNNL